MCITLGAPQANSPLPTNYSPHFTDEEAEALSSYIKTSPRYKLVSGQGHHDGIFMSLGFFFCSSPGFEFPKPTQTQVLMKTAQCYPGEETVLSSSHKPVEGTSRRTLPPNGVQAKQITGSCPDPTDPFLNVHAFHWGIRVELLL